MEVRSNASPSPLASMRSSCFALRLTHYAHLRTCIRHMSRNAECYTEVTVAQASPPPPTFESVGVRPAICASVRLSFPHVRQPTPTQAEFIPAVIAGKDVLIKDTTGSGKSFGLILALLSKPRLRFAPDKAQLAAWKGKVPTKPISPTITALVVVPHRELGYQMMHWIERMAVSASSSPHLPSIAQLLVRDASKPMAGTIEQLKTTPPHIIVGTAQMVLDVYRADPTALQLSTLSTVVADEIDSMVETVPRLNDKRLQVKAAAAIARHPGPTRELLNIIYASRINSQQRESRDTDSDYRRPKPVDSGNAVSLPQFVAMSATTRVHLRTLLYHNGWMESHSVVKVNGPRQSVAEEEEEEENGAAGNHQSHSPFVHHCALIVSPSGDIVNIAGARKVADRQDAEQAAPAEATQAEPENLFVLDPKHMDKWDGTPSPFNPDVLDAVATAFALDVPALALLILPSGPSIHRAVYELRNLGVQADPLDLSRRSEGIPGYALRPANVVKRDPRLLVASSATVRGLDLPGLTHVFILGILDGARPLEAYLHASGRVGRFDQRGTVVSVLEKPSNVESTPWDDHRSFPGDRGSSENPPKRKDEPAQLSKILAMLNVIPTVFEHFD